MNGSIWRVFGAIVIVILLATVTSAREIRPDPLLDEAGCELWAGLASGNDPSMWVEFRLCPGEENEVLGAVQFSSLISGWSIREITGSRRIDGGYVLQEISFLEQLPAGHWYFCLVDEYQLSLVNANRLEGTYRAEGCDSGTVALDRVDPDNPPQPPTEAVFDEVETPVPEIRGVEPPETVVDP